MKIFYTLFLLLLLSIMGCDKETTPVHVKSKPLGSYQSTRSSKPPTSNNSAVTGPEQPMRSDGKWVQLGHRLYYIQGTVKSFQRDSN